MAAAVIPLAALLWVWTTPRPPPPVAAEPGEHFATAHGQQLVQVLPDGSALHLNTDTAVTVRYQANSRRVELEHGQVVFKVAHDPARPFRVTAGSAQVTAVGTQFDVYLQNEATVVTVVEGKVAVAPVAGSNRAPLLVGAGEQVRVVRGELPAQPSVVDPSLSTAWLNRQISFRHEPLSQVVAEFNRYAATPIRIESPALGNLPVSGVFNVDDTESMVAFLRSLAGVKVEVTPSAIRVSGG
jgi:transmembrane sensor